MNANKHFNLKKRATSALLSTMAVTAVIATPAIVAQADVHFTGTTQLPGELLFTKQVDVVDNASPEALRQTKVIIAPHQVGSMFDFGNLSIKQIEIRDAVTLKGLKLQQAEILLIPSTVNSTIDLSASNATNLTVGNDNVSKIIVADAVKEITIAEGVTSPNPIVVDANGKVRTDITFHSGQPSPLFDLSIMHFNDTHAHLDNAAKRVTAVNEVRAEKPDALLLDAGDVFSGTLYFNEFLGEADVKFMNMMKVDAMTFGNHEFDLGSSPEGHQALKEFIQAANFPFVSSNVDFSKDPLFEGLFSTKIATTPENSHIYNGIVKEINGEKVGIFGLTTAETANISSPGAIEFKDYIEEAKKMVAEFEKMGINKVIALTHIGYDDNPNVDNDIELAKAVEGIDVIVGGHSHSTLAKPIVIDDHEAPTLIVQAGQYAEHLGVLDVTFDGQGVVVSHNGELIKIGEKKENPEAAKVLKEYAEQIEKVKNEPTGATATQTLENPRTGGDVTMPSVRKNETPLGNLITDGMLAKAKTYNAKVVMAFQNGGGIREAIQAGPITVGEVISVLPFGNTLATMDVSGAELKQAFEISVGQYPAENGGFLHVSGAKVQFDSTQPTGKRIVSIAYKNADGQYVDVQDEKTYTVATNAFTAKGGDGYDVFKKAYAEGRVTDLGLSDWENLRDHVASLKTVNPKVEQRIVDVSENVELPGGEVDADDFSGTAEAPKVYNGNVTVAISDMASFEHVTVKGNLSFTGDLSEHTTFTNIVIEGDLDVSELNTERFTFDGIQVSGDVIF